MYTYIFAQNMERIFNIEEYRDPDISDQVLEKIRKENIHIGVPGIAPVHNAGPKKWITNGEINRFVEREDPIPEGWRKGRSNCVFNDPEKQKEFASRVDREKSKLAAKKAWDEGKMDHRNHAGGGMLGDKNPTKRPEVKEKIRQAALRDSKNRSERIKRVKPWLSSDGGWERTRMRKNDIPTTVSARK